MVNPRETLASLLAPMDPDEFLDAFYQRRPTVIRGSTSKTLGVLSLADVVYAITGEREPAGRLLVDREHLRADGVPSAAFAARFRERIEEGTEPFWAYLEEGHAIVWNGARGATAALDRLCDDLAAALGADVWANVYATGTAGTPLDFHFDCHEVIALQLEGEKEWTVSNVRVEHPLDVPALRPVIERTLETRRAEALADLAFVTTVGPGDVVYLPRGQFHNARAAGGRSLHVSFGIEHSTGLDVLEAVLAEAVEHGAFRAYVPPPELDPTRERRREHLADLARRAAALVESPEVDALLAQAEVRLRTRRRPG